VAGVLSQLVMYLVDTPLIYDECLEKNYGDTSGRNKNERRNLKVNGGNTQRGTTSDDQNFF
jgi:hypothetical protein